MPSEPVVRRENTPQRTALAGCGALEAANNSLPASGTKRRHPYPAEGADASIQRVIRQPR
jgi:ribonuclease PH